MSCLLWKSVTFMSLVWAVRGQISGDLRLVGRTGGFSGRLEFFYNGQWGTVCDDSFGPNDARVACRQLGFSSYTLYGNVATLGFSQASSITRIWLDELRCSGIESRLIDCLANPIGVEDCSHSEDVALICFTGLSLSYNWKIAIAGIVVSLLVAIPIVTLLIVFSVRSLIRRRRRLALYARSTPLINNAASTDVVGVTASNTQDTAYPVQQPMDQTPPYSPQPPPQNMQPVAVYPTGQYADPEYHTSYPQQPPAPYSTGQPSPAGQPLPAQYPTGQPPPAQYPAGQPPPAQYPAGQPLPAQYPAEQPPPAQYPAEQPPPAQYPTGQPPSAQ
ncbi:uncharacterized protein LOC135336574 [Halichondria panicea]|uniref:uncharacterized protein LOC135336574 n=1 Tax=Halichondria panicea TaxID=6063 RepID=UPI00312B65F3